MNTVAKGAGFGLLEYGIAGIFILFLIGLFWFTQRAAQKERETIEARDTERETKLRLTVAKSFDERHDDAIKLFCKVSRIEAKLNIKDTQDRDGC
tara:strand:- start:880 stop:1164 length:285 start_codon:yes stop_codon:yes gene_type:complete